MQKMKKVTKNNRLDMLMGKRPCFSDWRVILIASESKERDIKIILEAGGANVISCTLDNISNSISHILVDTSRLKSHDEFIKLYPNFESRIFKIDYISSFLLDGPNSAQLKYLLSKESIEKLRKK